MKFVDALEKRLNNGKEYSRQYSLGNCLLDIKQEVIKNYQIGFFYNEYDTEKFGFPVYTDANTENINSTEDDQFVISFFKKNIY